MVRSQSVVTRRPGHDSGGPGRHEHGGTESAVGGERSESEFWQRNGEHGDDAVVDADVDGDVSSDGELCCDHRDRLHDRRRYLTRDAESDPVVTLQVQFLPTATGTASGQITISSDSSTGSHDSGGPGRYEHSGTESSVDGERSESEFWQRNGEHGDDADVDADVDGDVSSDGELCCDHRDRLHDRWRYLTRDAEPDPDADAAGAVPPTATGTASGQITISSDSSTGSTAVVALSGTATAAPNPQLTVSAASLSFGSVTVNTAATQTLTLTSSGTSPVTVNSAAITGAGFTIAAQSFPVTLNPAQSLTLQVQFDPTATGTASGQITISSNSTTGSTALVALGGTGTAANPQLTVSATTLSFGSVTVNTATTQSLTLTSSGTTPVTVSSAAITGAGFTIVGGSFPVTLNPTQTLTLQLQFEPTTAGALTGQITINSNSTSGSTAVVSLSGTGTAVAHEVDLSWDAPASSPDPVAGYNIYRATGSGSLALINSSPDSAVTYVDSAVVSGATYSYVVKSVDSSGVESVASNEIMVTIP